MSESTRKAIYRESKDHVRAITALPQEDENGHQQSTLYFLGTPEYVSSIYLFNTRNVYEEIASVLHS